MTTVRVTDYPKIRALADRLVASCDGGRDEWDIIDELTPEECKLLDSMALECVCCNQWHAAADMTDVDGGYVCSDCL